MQHRAAFLHALIVTTTDDMAVNYQYRSYWNAAGKPTLPSFFDCSRQVLVHSCRLRRAEYAVDFTRQLWRKAVYEIQRFHIFTDLLDAAGAGQDRTDMRVLQAPRQ